MKNLSMMCVLASLILAANLAMAGGGGDSSDPLSDHSGVTMRDYNDIDGETELEDLGQPESSQDLGNGRYVMTFSGSALQGNKDGEKTIEYSTTVYVENGEIVAKQITEERDGKSTTFASILNDSKFQNAFGDTYTFAQGEERSFLNESGSFSKAQTASITPNNNNGSGGGAVVVVGQDDTGNVVSI